MLHGTSSCVHWLFKTPEISFQDHAPSVVEAAVCEEQTVHVCALVAGSTEFQRRCSPVDERVAK
jgi:hypothetical protein